MAALLAACSVYDSSLLLPGDAGSSGFADGGDAQSGGGGAAGIVVEAGTAEASTDGGAGLGGATGDGGEEDASDGAAADAGGAGGAGGAAGEGGTGGSSGGGGSGPGCGNGVVEQDEECEPPGTSTCDAECHAQCDMSGKWALKVTLPVSWGGSLLKNGSGTIVHWSLLDRRIDGAKVTDTVDVCEILVPDFFDSVLNSRLGLSFSSPLGLLSSTPTTTTFDRLNVGGRYTMPATAFLMGVDMALPTVDPWPPGNSGKTLADNAKTMKQPYAKDGDGDGKLGITTTPKSGGTYTDFRVQLLTGIADKVYLAVRMVESMSGTIEGCSLVSGDVTLAALNLAVVGCHVKNGGDCVADDRDTLDSMRPTYAAETGASFIMQKLDASATCVQAIAKIP